MNLNALKLIKSNDIERTLSLVVAGSLLIALGAQIRIPLGITPVPVTLQTFAILLLASTIGARNAMLAVLLYLAEGMMGLPVMKGGTVNPLALIGPTGGYLVAMVGQAYAAGWLFERAGRFSPMTLFLAVSLTCFLQLAFGALWLGLFVGAGNIIAMGILPFLPGEILKTIAVAGYSSSVVNR